MSDIKLFRLGPTGITELPGEAVQVEKSLQTLFERNLDALLGVRFLASEHSTGPVHGGRIDTLGLDEDGSPVIIEYKRSVNETVINQGLFYLDWLLDHRGDFELLVQKRLGAEAAERIDWAGPRLLCIAGDFTRYDEHAVKQIARNIELLRYRRFGDDLLMIELVHVPTPARPSPIPVNAEPRRPAAIGPGDGADPYTSHRIAHRIAQAPAPLRDLYDAVSRYLQALGDDVQVKELKNYIAYKRIKNFAYVEVYPQARVVTVYLKIDPKSVTLEEGFTRDMSEASRYTGDLAVSLRSMEDFTRAQPLLVRSYEGS